MSFGVFRDHAGVFGRWLIDMFRSEVFENQFGGAKLVLMVGITGDLNHAAHHVR